uniref:Uncharacterized protein n=1 Tax=Rhizophora mucronata TaxID=61149 RepID=A0A2P2QGA2_RHIMU
MISISNNTVKKKSGGYSPNINK